MTVPVAVAENMTGEGSTEAAALVLGKGTEQDYGQAMECWRAAAEMGYALAYEAIGELYRDALGVEQDYEKAADYFLKAVELGETSESQANFDQLVEQGKIPADYTMNPDTFDEIALDPVA